MPRANLEAKWLHPDFFLEGYIYIYIYDALRDTGSSLSTASCSVKGRLAKVFEEAVKLGICRAQPKVAKWCKKELG